jgi:DNA recombination protein RmuC
MSIENIILIAIVAVLFLFVVIVMVLFYKKTKNTPQISDTSDIRVLLAEQNAKFEEKFNQLADSHKELVSTTHQSKNESVKLSEKIDGMSKMSQEMNNFQGQIQGQLEKLHQTTTTLPETAQNIRDIYKLYDNSKNRGTLGEIHLETILNNVFGKNKNLIKPQYHLENGNIIDFCIEAEKPIFIDAKFPKDN